MKRFAKLAIPLILLAILLAWAFRPSPVAADFVTVQRGDLEVTVNEEGRTRVRDRYVVSAPLPGRMRRIDLEPGDPVIAGKTVVATFEPADPVLLDVRSRAELQARASAAEASVGRARAERERLQAEAALAESELKRLRRLLEERVISAREMEIAERQAEAAARAVQSAEFAVRTAQHELEMARASLLQSRSGRATTIPLLSPVDGVILRRLQQSEAVVPTGQPLLEIGDVHDLEIVADLLSSAAVRVQAGQPVIIEHWGGEHPLRGRVRRVEPSGFTKISALGVEEQRVNTVIDFEEPPKDRGAIGDGYRVEVRIIVSSRQNVLKIPTASLLRHGDDWAVFVVEDERAVRRVVSVGQRNALEAEVTGGLNEGERIIAYPSDSIANGVRVSAR